MTLVKDFQHLPSTAPRATRGGVQISRHVLPGGPAPEQERFKAAAGKNVRSNTFGEGRAFTPSRMQQLRFEHPDNRAPRPVAAPQRPSLLRRGVNAASRVATSRGGVLVSGLVLTLSFGLAPLVVGEDAPDQGSSAGTVATASVAAGAAAD